MDELAGKPVGFLYSKRRAREALRKSYYRPKVAPNQQVINWANPTAEDIAAGLSDEQCQALIELRIARSSGPHQVSLDKPVPGWRDALFMRQGAGDAMLTSMGERVRKVLLTQCAHKRSEEKN